MIVNFQTKDVNELIGESESRIAHTKKTGAMDHTTKGSRQASELGVLGEAAVARITGYAADGFEYKGKGKSKDVGPLQVRTTERGVLYFKDFENPNDAYVAVQKIGDNRFNVVGWAFGFECQKSEYQRFPRDKRRMRPGQKCWWQIPHDRLHSLSSLEEWCISHGHKKWAVTTEVT